MTTLSANTKLIEDRIQELCETLQEKFCKQYNSLTAYEVKRGVKYYKIIHVCNPGTKYEGRSVHAFVARQTGTIYKPASWQAPAKHARYQLLDDQSFATCLEHADWAGSYLYLK
jgi:transposase